MKQYFLKDGDGDWYVVSKSQWVLAERMAGFHNTMGQPNEPGTASWSVDQGGLRMSGKIETGIDEDVREFLESRGLTSESE